LHCHSTHFAHKKTNLVARPLPAASHAVKITSDAASSTAAPIVALRGTKVGTVSEPAAQLLCAPAKKTHGASKNATIAKNTLPL